MNCLNQISPEEFWIPLLIGALLFVTHLLGLLASDFCIEQYRRFYRSRVWSSLFITLATCWTFSLVAITDLGEFSSIRNQIMIAILVGAFLLWKFVPDFLASRSLGFLLLLAPYPILRITFLQTGILKLLLVLLAYSWAILGLFLVAMPYLQRDFISWISLKKWRWNLSCLGGICYGFLLILEGIKIKWIG